MTWFEDESDPTLNSNVYEIAQLLVQKHFPGKNAPAHYTLSFVADSLEETQVLFAR